MKTLPERIRDRYFRPDYQIGWLGVALLEAAIVADMSKR